MNGSKSILIVLSIIILVLAGASGYLYMNNVDLHAQVEDLTSKNQALQNQVQSLQNDKASLQSQLDQLQNQLNELIQERDNLIAQVNNLTEIKRQLEAQVQDLQEENADLTQEIQDLQNQIDQLNEEIQQLNQKIDELNDQIQDLYKIINLELQTTIASETINLPYNYYYKVTFYANYSGYLIFRWTATVENLTIYVEGYYEGNYYVPRYRYLEAGGAIIIPVLPGRVNVYLINDIASQGATITYELIYVY